MNNKAITRTQILEIWFGAVILVSVAFVAFDVAMTITTAAVLLGLSLVAPVILLMLWPDTLPTPTAHDVLHGAGRPTHD